MLKSEVGEVGELLLRVFSRQELVSFSAFFAACFQKAAN